MTRRVPTKRVVLARAALFLLLLPPLLARGGEGAFAVDPRGTSSDGAVVLRPRAAALPDGSLEIAFTVPEGLKLQAGSLSASLDGEPAAPGGGGTLPKPVATPFSDEPVPAWEGDVRLVFPGASGTRRAALSYSLCSASQCFPPADLAFVRGGASGAGEGASAPPGDAARPWRVVARADGYSPPKAFLSALGLADAPDPAVGRAAPRGGLALLLAVFLGGILLNLSPCVLPMIPVNLAVIGAGAGARSRKTGFARGALYGLGMAVAYGALGLAAALGGAQVGALQSSVLFNALLAAVFLILALGLFDLLPVDFSRLRSPAGSFGSVPTGATAFALGAAAAVLAGACVAPVLAATLVLTAERVNGGQPHYALLPFALGLGMGFPWPFAGAGLAVLPRPGRWMAHVRRAFAVLLLLFAATYAVRAARLLRPSAPEGAVSAADAIAAVNAALERASARGAKVFVALGADWCTACGAMERTTLRDPAVEAALVRLETVHVDCGSVRDAAAKELLRRLDARGLPAYRVLEP